jgi:hypothetical protein
MKILRDEDLMRWRSDAIAPSPPTCPQINAQGHYTASTRKQRFMKGAQGYCDLRGSLLSIVKPLLRSHSPGSYSVNVFPLVQSL